MDSQDNVAAEVVHKSNPTVLVESAGQPSLSVNSDQDKFVLDFKTKMKDSAKEISNYKIYDDRGNKIPGIANDDLSEVVKESTTADWVDSTSKKAVEFELEPGKLDAGKTYRVVVDQKVKTDDGDTLSDSQRRINVQTPSISEARPVAKIARVSDTNEITLTFDKKLAKGEVNSKLVEVKTPTGKSIEIDTVISTDDNKELVITTKENLDKEITYTVNAPENAVANYVFQNATNEKVSNMSAKAQDNIAVASMSAKFERDVKDKEKADLLLTFDQRVKDIAGVDGLDLSKLAIEESGKTPASLTGLVVEYDTNDPTGKTLRVKNITSKVDLESDKNYKVVLQKDGVTTDSAEGIKNQKELTSTINGLDVSAPVIDNVEFASAEKIVVEFDKVIESNIKASDLYVQGFRLEKAGAFKADELNGSSDLQVSVSGKKLTITPADNETKFVTGHSSQLGTNNFVKIKAEKVKGSNEVVQKDEMSVAFTSNNKVALKVDGTVTESDLDFIDNAKPIMVGAVTGTNAVAITFSEAVEAKGGSAENIGNQFSVENAEIKNYGSIAAALTSNSNEVKLGFADVDGESVIEAKDYADLKVIYRAHTSYELKDAKGNKVADSTLTGAKNATVTGAPTPTPELSDAEQALVDAEAAVEELDENEYTTASWGAITTAKALTATTDVAKAYKAEQINAAIDGLVTKVEAAKSELETAIETAKEVEQVETSDDGTNIDPSEQWTTEAVLTAFEEAISNAESVLENEDADESALNNAKTTLEAAVTTYENEKANGTAS